MRVSIEWRAVTFVLLAASVALASPRPSYVTSLEPKYARAVELPAGAVPPNTMRYLCSAGDWARALPNVPPPEWVRDPAPGILVIGPFHHGIACAKTEVRGPENGRPIVVTLQPTGARAPANGGGCAVEVGRTVQEEPIEVRLAWPGDRELLVVKDCGLERQFPATDVAGVLRVRFAESPEPPWLEGADLTLIDRNGQRRATATVAHGEAVFFEVPAVARQQLELRRDRCGTFGELNLPEIEAGTVISVDVDLGRRAALTVRLTEWVGGLPIPAAGVRVTVVPDGRWPAGSDAITDRDGAALFDCLPARSRVHIRLSDPLYEAPDVCDVVTTDGDVVDVNVTRRVPNAPRRVIPPPCADAGSPRGRTRRLGQRAGSSRCRTGARRREDDRLASLFQRVTMPPAISRPRGVSTGTISVLSHAAQCSTGPQRRQTS